MSDVEDLATELAQAWLETYAQRGAKAYTENERRRADIIARARELDIYEAVYSRANSIMHGN